MCSGHGGMCTGCHVTVERGDGAFGQRGQGWRGLGRCVNSLRVCIRAEVTWAGDRAN